MVSPCSRKREQEKLLNTFGSRASIGGTYWRILPLPISNGRAAIVDKHPGQADPFSRFSVDPLCKLLRAFAYTIRMGPGYFATNESIVSSAIPSTVACATKRRSNGSL
jgi:hypothetical protein